MINIYSKIKKLQEQYVSIDKEIKANLKLLEKNIKNYLKSIGLEQEFLEFNAGSSTNNWEPSIYFFEFEKYYEEESPKELDELINLVQNAYPFIKIEKVYKKKLTRENVLSGMFKPEYFKILLDDPECNVIDGEVWYKGWDIPDKFYIIESNDEWYLINYRDCDLNNLHPVKDVLELNEFFNFIEQDSDNDWVRKMYYDKIIECLC